MSFINPDNVIKELQLQPGMSVADFGSGSGSITVLMAKAVGDSGQVFAIDVLISALESVQGKAKLENIRNIKTIRSNLEIFKNSGLDNESMDLVLMANILFQSKLRKNILQEAKRVAKSGAKIIIIDWEPMINYILKDLPVGRPYYLGIYHVGPDSLLNWANNFWKKIPKKGVKA